MGAEACFVDQIATKEILLRVTNLCGVCYADLCEGEHIYYDMQHYRYLCEHCKCELSERMNDACEIIDEEDGGLF
jgi:hypothetical protein